MGDFNAQVLLKDGRHRYSLCSDYALLLNEVLQCLETAARVIWLEGHVVTEYFDPLLEKWVFIDPSLNVCGYDADGTPLSVTEIIAAAETSSPVQFVAITPDPETVAAHSHQFDPLNADQVGWYRNILLNGECSTCSGSTLQTPSRWAHLLRSGSVPSRLILASRFDTSHAGRSEPLSAMKVGVIMSLLLVAFLVVQYRVR